MTTGAKRCLQRGTAVAGWHSSRGIDKHLTRQQIKQITDILTQIWINASLTINHKKNLDIVSLRKVAFQKTCWKCTKNHNRTQTAYLSIAKLHVCAQPIRMLPLNPNGPSLIKKQQLPFSLSTLTTAEEARLASSGLLGSYLDQLGCFGGPALTVFYFQLSSRKKQYIFTIYSIWCIASFRRHDW